MIGLRGMGDDPRGEANRRGEDEALVINSVFAHQIDATGRAENAGFRGKEAAIPLP